MPLSKCYFLLIAGTILVSCDSNKTPSTQVDNLFVNSKAYALTLPDSLGSVELLIPTRYDTFFKWTHFSDCTGCGWKKYRFQPKTFPIFKESGWLWYDLADSVDRLTIAHSDYTEKTGWRINYRDTSAQKTIQVRHNMLLEMAKTNQVMRYVTSDTVQQINGAWYSIIAGENYDSTSKVYAKFVVGTSEIRFNEITFKFQMLTKINDSICRNFIKNSIRLLGSIKIHNGI